MSSRRAKAVSEAAAPGLAVLELVVNNHRGVMIHVCGLFSRRAYDVMGIACMPCRSGCGRIWVLFAEETRLGQVIKQLSKLQDVIAVRKHGRSHAVFEQLKTFFAD